MDAKELLKFQKLKAPELVAHSQLGEREHDEVTAELWRRLRLQAGRVALRANEEAKR